MSPGAEAGGVEGAGEAPVVGPRPFRIVDRSGRGEDAGEARRRRGVQAAEGQPAAVQLDQLGLAQQRQAGQRGAGRDLVGLDAGQPLGEPGRVVDRVAHQARQGVEHRGLALGGRADLLPVVVGAAFLWAHAPTPLSGTAPVLAHIGKPPDHHHGLTILPRCCDAAWCASCRLSARLRMILRVLAELDTYDEHDRGRTSFALPGERQRLILERLARDGRVVAAALARELGTSEDTIRRDLRELAAAGRCERVYGGALRLSPASGSFAQREATAPARKAALGRRAAALVRPGQILLIHAGTTNVAIAAALPERQGLTVATNAPAVATALLGREGSRCCSLAAGSTTARAGPWGHGRCATSAACGPTSASWGLARSTRGPAWPPSTPRRPRSSRRWSRRAAGCGRGDEREARHGGPLPCRPRLGADRPRRRGRRAGRGPGRAPRVRRARPRCRP